MRVILIIMSLVTISIKSFNLSRKISTLNYMGRRSFQIQTSRFSTQDLQGKLFTPFQSTDGLDLMKIGIGTDAPICLIRIVSNFKNEAQ